MLEHFGVEAAGKLNAYCIALEDALVEQVEHLLNAQKEVSRLRALLQEHDIPYKT